jgi:hypothetical protein
MGGMGTRLRDTGRNACATLLSAALLFGGAAGKTRPTQVSVAFRVESGDPVSPRNLMASLDGRRAPVLRVRGPKDDLLLILVLDIAGELAAADTARKALVESVNQLPPGSHVALMRAQDGLRVLLDPTPDRGKVADTIANLPVSGRAGLLDTVEQAARIGDSILSRSTVRVAILYVTDSSVHNYREDFTNPVINSSDSRDMSRRFPEGLVKERIARVAENLASFQPPLFVLHLQYSTDTLNEAYQSGLMQLATTTGGAAAFCRSRMEIPEVTAKLFETLKSLSIADLKLPDRPLKNVPIQLESENRVLTYRNRFVIRGR